MEVREFAFPKTGTLSTPFVAYREMVRRRFPESLAQSRLDAMTALYLRCAGYSAKDVDSEMERHTPAPANDMERRENIRCRQRLLAYAFGTAGDIDIAAVQPTLEQIQKYNSEAEQIERDRIEPTQPAFRLR